MESASEDRSVSEEGGRGPARLLARSETPISSWLRIVRKEVQFQARGAVETYHCLAQADYVAVAAITRDGRVPLVRQYRPAVDAYTWELPAGLVDEGETPEGTCRRELKEEAGVTAESVTYLGSFYADTGRLENRLHAFYVRASDPDPSFTPESNLEVDYVSLERLREMIRSRSFRHQLHLGVLLTAWLEGFPLGG
jgi:ADP-ribose pyrophosphatase